MSQKSWMIQPIPKSMAKQELPYQQFRVCIFTFYCWHTTVPLLFGLFVHIKIENNISYSIKESLVFFIYNLPLSHFTSSDTSYLAKFLQPFQILLNLACGQPYALCRLSCPDLRILGNQFVNLANLIYNYLTICKWVVYEFCFRNKKQIRNKNGFLGKSSFFCLHYFSFLSLACNQSTNPSYYYAFSSWFNICFFIYPGIRSEKRKVLFSMIDINMCKVKNNHPSNQIFVYF